MQKNSVGPVELFDFMRQHNLTQSKMAAEAGIPLSRLSAYLRDVAKMDVVDAVKIRAAMRQISRRQSS